MDCEKVCSLMSFYLDGLLAPEEETEFLEHLSSCETCRKELEDLKEIVEELHTLPMIDLPYGYHEEVMEKINAQKVTKVDFTARKKTIWKKYSAVAAALLILVAAGRQYETMKNYPKSAQEQIKMTEGQNAAESAPAPVSSEKMDTDDAVSPKENTVETPQMFMASEEETAGNDTVQSQNTDASHSIEQQEAVPKTASVSPQENESFENSADTPSVAAAYDGDTQGESEGAEPNMLKSAGPRSAFPSMEEITWSITINADTSMEEIKALLEEKGGMLERQEEEGTYVFTVFSGSYEEIKETLKNQGVIKTETEQKIDRSEEIKEILERKAKQEEALSAAYENKEDTKALEEELEKSWQAFNELEEKTGRVEIRVTQEKE